MKSYSARDTARVSDMTSDLKPIFIGLQNQLTWQEINKIVGQRKFKLKCRYMSMLKRDIKHQNHNLDQSLKKINNRKPEYNDILKQVDCGGQKIYKIIGHSRSTVYLPSKMKSNGQQAPIKMVNIPASRFQLTNSIPVTNLSIRKKEVLQIHKENVRMVSKLNTMSNTKPHSQELSPTKTARLPDNVSFKFLNETQSRQSVRRSTVVSMTRHLTPTKLVPITVTKKYKQYRKSISRAQSSSEKKKQEFITVNAKQQSARSSQSFAKPQENFQQKIILNARLSQQSLFNVQSSQEFNILQPSMSQPILKQIKVMKKPKNSLINPIFLLPQVKIKKC